MFEPHLDLSDIGPSDQEREIKVLSRCVAALAVYLVAGCTTQEAAASVWDCGDDNGIDAAYYDESVNTVLFVQSKFIQKGSGEPDAKDVGAFTKGVLDAIESNEDSFGPRVQAKLDEISLRLRTPGTQLHLIVASTGASRLAKHATSVITKALKDLNGDDPDQIATARTMGLAEIYTGLTNDLSAGNVSLDATIFDWSLVSSPIHAYYGIVEGPTLKEWWVKHGKGLLSTNIRHSLGATDVNNQIRATVQDSPQLFWYFNNGITLVCEEALKAPASSASRSAGLFSFRGASLVNGAQTVSTIGAVDDETQLAQVRVPVRVIVLKGAPPTFGADVTRANNLQNRIEQRDFVAQDPEQHRLRREMAVEGIVYQIVRSEEASSSAKACDLTEVITALACAAGDSSMAVNLKTGIGRFFADLSKPPYRSLFNPTLTGPRAFNAVLVQRVIDDWIERTKKRSLKKSGPAWGVLVHGNRILSSAVFGIYGDSKIQQPIESFQKSLDAAAIESIAVTVHERMTDAISTHYSGKFLATLFKNPKMSRHVLELAKSEVTVPA
jgi:hypothetical protein